MAERIAIVNQIPGDDWIADGRAGKPTQAARRYLLRRMLWDRVTADGWRLVSEPEEHVEFDEKAREVKLWISAMAERPPGPGKGWVS